MEKFKKAFFDLLHSDKVVLIFTLAQLSIGLLFWIAIFMPYIVSPDLISGRLSTLELPGGTLYTILFLGLIVLFAYQILMKKSQAAHKVFLVLAILATLIYFYALLFNTVGLPNARNGIGKVLEFLMVIMFWLFIFGKKHIEKILHKIITKKADQTVNKVEE